MHWGDAYSWMCNDNYQGMDTSPRYQGDGKHTSCPRAIFIV